jgi:hypothetical protein
MQVCRKDTFVPLVPEAPVAPVAPFKPLLGGVVTVPKKTTLPVDPAKLANAG